MATHSYMCYRVCQVLTHFGQKQVSTPACKLFGCETKVWNWVCILAFSSSDAFFFDEKINMFHVKSRECLQFYSNVQAIKCFINVNVLTWLLHGPSPFPLPPESKSGTDHLDQWSRRVVHYQYEHLEINDNKNCTIDLFPGYLKSM